MRQIRSHLTTAFCVALIAGPATARIASELPTPGCYQTDWSARYTKGSGGIVQTTMMTTIDGATGTQITIVTGPDGKSFTTTAQGKGPVKRMFGSDGQWVEPYCPQEWDDKGKGQIDFKMACETFTVDPATLKLTKIINPIEKWSANATVKMTSQAGLNNLPAAKRDMIENMKRILSSAKPRTDQERAQVAQQQQALAKLEQEWRAPNPALDQTRRDAEEKIRTGNPEEQRLARMMLDGAVMEQNMDVTEVLTWAGSAC
jgi:hypothetical protein